MQRFADTVGKRDERIQHLLGEASKVAGVLGIHGDQINRLLVNAQTLLSAITTRTGGRSPTGQRQAVAAQVQGLINDNPNLNTVLKQVNAVSDVLVKRKDDLTTTVTELGKFVASLSEIVSSGPYVKAAIFNSCPIRCFSRGLTPRSRSAVSTRRTFGAAPGYQRSSGPTPTATGFPMERHHRRRRYWRAPRAHPGPAVLAGSPCSYTPARLTA